MKQKLSRMLFIAFATLFSMASFAQKSVLSEDFSSGKLPADWKQTGMIWSFEDGAVFKTTLLDGVDTLIAPMVNISELNKPVVSLEFELPAVKDVTDTVTVLYRLAANQPWMTFGLLPKADERQTWTVELSKELVTTVQVAFVGKNASAGGAKLFYFAIENMSECSQAPQNLKYEELNSTGVILSWDVCTASSFKGYNLKVSTKELENPAAYMGDIVDVNATQLTDEFYDLTGQLQPNTTYHVYVQNECQDNDMSPWTYGTFTTPCEAITIPYSDDFEGTLNECYQIVKSKSTAKVVTTYAYAYEGKQSLYFYSPSGTDTYFYTQELNGNIQDYQVTFMGANFQTGNYARSIEVGVADNFDPSSYVMLKLIELPKLNEWEQVCVSLAGYTGTGKYIVFKSGNADKANYFYMDDLKIEPAAPCPMPMFLGVDNITSTTAEIHWIEAGNSTEWNLIVSKKKITDFDAINPDDKENYPIVASVSQNPYKATGLQPKTKYYVYLQAGCANAQWTKEKEFITTKMVTYPYYESFDKMSPSSYTDDRYAVPDGWVSGLRYTSGGVDRTVSSWSSSYDNYLSYMVTSQNHNVTPYVSASLRVYGYSTTYSGYAITPELPLESLKDKMISFWMKAKSTSYGLVIAVAKSQDTELPEDKMFKDTANYFAIDTIYASVADQWEYQQVPIYDYTGSGKYILLRTVGGTLETFIDDIEIGPAIDFFTAKNLQAEALGTKHIKATWQDKGRAQSWKVKVSTTPIDPATATANVYEGIVNGTTYENQTLNANTTYYIYVRPNGDAPGVEWAGTEVTTMYGISELPFEETFDVDGVEYKTGANANRGPQYWILGNPNLTAAIGTQTYVPYLQTTAWKNPVDGVTTPYLYIYHSNSATQQGAYAILPEVSCADVKDLALSFYGYYNSTTSTANYAVAANKHYGVIHIGVLDSPTDINKTDKFDNVTKIATVRCAKAQTPEPFVVNFADYKGTGKYIVLYSDTNKYNYFCVDNLKLNYITAPQQVSDVEMTSVTTNSANLTWKENGMATQWEVKVFDHAAEDIDNETPAFQAQVSDTKAVVATGLKHSTRYYAYVRSVMGTQLGEWSAAATFYTESAPMALPFYEDFNAYDVGNYNNNTLPPFYGIKVSKENNSVACAYVKAANGSYAYAQDHTYGKDAEKGLLYMNASYSGPYQVFFILPEFETPLNQINVRFYGGYSTAWAPSASTAGYVQVGYIDSLDQYHRIEDCKFLIKNEYNEFNVDCSSLPASAKGRLCFAMPNSEDEVKRIGGTYVSSGVTKQTWTAYIDDVSITPIPQCKRVEDVKTSVIESNAATIYWSKVATETAYNIKLATKEIDPLTQAGDVLETQTDKTAFQFTSLEPNTTYYAYVQTVDAAKECTGEWSLPCTWTTMCAPIAYPYYEDFETGYAENDLYQCAILNSSASVKDFALLDKTSATSYPNKVEDDSDFCLVLKQSAKDNIHYFVFPMLDVDSIKHAQLSMFVEPQYAGWQHYAIGVMTDPYDAATFVEVAKDSVYYNSTEHPARPWYEKSYTFASYETDYLGNVGKYVAIRIDNYVGTTGTKSTGQMYIDNVSIRPIDKCPNPTELAVALNKDDDHALDITWNSIVEGADFQVCLYKSKPADINTAVPAVAKTVQDTTATTVAGLEGNTPYYVVVRMVCGQDEYGPWCKGANIRTGCDPTQPLPINDNFDEYIYASSSNAMPYCWGRTSVLVTNPGGAPATTSLPYLKFKDSTYPAKSGTTCLYMPKNTSVITPMLEIDSTKKAVLYFDAAGKCTETSPSTIGVYVTNTQEWETDPNAEAFFIAEFEFTINNQYKACYVDLESYNSVKNYKYILFTSGGSGSGVMLDNLVITTDKSKIIPVKDLLLTSLSDDYIAFEFDEITPKISSWVVQYGPEGFALGTGTTKQITTENDTITGLAASTSYDIYVRADKEGAEWAGPLTCKTSPSVAELPYRTGFEDEEDNKSWTLYNTKATGVEYENTFTIGDASKAGATGNKALYIQHDGDWQYITKYTDPTDPTDYVVGTSYVYATRFINVAEPGSYMFTFKLKNPGNTKPGNEDDDYINLMLVPADAYPDASNIKFADGTNVNQSTTNEEKGTYVICKQATLYGITEWQEYKQMLNVKEAGVYQIVLRWYNPATGEQDTLYKPAAIDSVIVEEYLCSPVEDIQYVDRKATSASFEWFGGKNKNFQVVVSEYAHLGDPGLVEDSYCIARENITTGAQYTITGLEPNSEYSLYVKPVCPGETTEWVEFPFTTACKLQTTPFKQTFRELPDCWTFTGAATVGSQNQYDSNNQLIDGLKVYYLSIPKASYVVFPELDIPLNKVALRGSFHYGSSTNTTSVTIKVGVVDNTYDMETFQEIKRYTSTDIRNSSAKPYIFDEIEVLMHLYQGTGKLLAIQGDPLYAVWFEYLQVTELPDCVIPTQVEVTDITDSTALVYWQKGLEDTWKIRVNGSENEIVTKSMPYKITGLTIGTNYTVEVAAICSDTTTSEWTTPVHFMTNCGAYPIPFRENFDGLIKEKSAAINCWENMCSDKPIQDVFIRESEVKPIEIGKYFSYTWAANYLTNYLGVAQQLWSWDYASTTYPKNYKWMVSPNIFISDSASLNFDMRHCTNKGDAATNHKAQFFVAISLDGGLTWKKEDATEFDLTNEDGQYHPRSVNLDKYVGDTIRFAFYHEGLTQSVATEKYAYILIDNVRVASVAYVNMQDDACANETFTNAHLTIPAGEVVGETIVKEVLVPSVAGKDSMITYTITVHQAVVDSIEAEICAGETYGNGFNASIAGLHSIVLETVYGCDSTVILNLSVLPADTAKVENVAINITQLPYVVDEYYTIPVDAAVGTFTQTIKPNPSECTYRVYNVEISEATATGLDQIQNAVAADVYDCTGTFIQSIQNLDKPFDLKAPAGIYLIRVRTSDGEYITVKHLVK